MMTIWLAALGTVFGVSLLSVIMGFVALSISEARLKKVLFVAVSFAVGALFGDAFIHILPESFEQIPSRLATPLLVITGFMIFFVVEKVILWRHFNMHQHAEHLQPVVTMNLIGDGVHNFIDGLLIGASFLVDIHIGIATAIAVTLHEIPQEIGDFGVLINGGLSVKKAMLFNLLSALAAVIGTLAALIVGTQAEGITIYLLPVTAGGFIYIAGPDLIPELHHEKKISSSLIQFLAIIAGVAVMASLLLLEGGEHASM